MNYSDITTSNKSLKFLYANARSIIKPGKLEELMCAIHSFRNITIHVIILTETWINSEREAKRIQLPGYTHYFNYRQNVRGGGVSIFAHNSVKHSLIEENTTDENHYLWVHINKFCLDVGAIYKPGRTNDNTFLEYYATQLENRKRAIIFGDFNYDLLSTDKSVLNYKDTVKESGYKIVNMIDQLHCTRETSKTKTILDHVCTNIKQNQFHLAIINSSMSDHKQIYFEVKKYKPEPIKSVTYEAINYNLLYETCETPNDDNMDSDYAKLEQKLKNSISVSKITKIKKCNPIKQDWINKDIITGIDTRNTLRLEHIRDPKDTKKEKDYFNARKNISQLIQHTKCQYYNKTFMNCQDQPKKMWTLINNLCHNKTKDITAPQKLKIESGIITDELEICEQFNLYFSTIGENLAKTISDRYNQNNTVTSVHCASKYTVSELTHFSATTEDEVNKIIINLSCNTASGIDGISSKAIKCVKNVIIVELTKCINKCLEAGIFPDSLKLAKVTPVFKSGSKSDPGNYRPISVLPILSKIFEKIIYNRLVEYLNSINFLSEKQYGFRRKSNTLSATIDLVTKIKTNIDLKHIALGVFIDLKKAFDTVSHTVLLNKLTSIGICGTAYDMLKSYLSNRTQIVKIGQCKSQPRPVSFGVPQGSIMGPLLFLVYVNNIHDIGLKGEITMYADDTSLFYFGQSIGNIIADAQDDLNLLNKWLEYNLLTINVSKTNYMIFKAKNKQIGDFAPLKINDQIIKSSDIQTYLGLILDNNLTWKPHIAKIKSKLISLTGALRGVARCFPRKVSYCIYNSLVKPHLDYLTEIWGSATKTNLNLIQRAQNKVIKVLFHYNFRTASLRLYKETKLLNVYQTYVYKNCLLIRKIITKDMHTQITFTKKKQLQKIQLRSANNLVLRAPRTNYGKKNILYEGAQLYNKLPNDIKSSQSILTFKKLLKYHVIKKLGQAHTK